MASRPPRKAILRCPAAIRCETALRAAGVVGEYGVGVEEARRAVEEHERDAAGAFAQVAVVGAGGDDDEGVDAPGGERCREPAFSLGVFVGAAGQGDDVAGPGDVLDAAVNGGEERVADVLQDQADAARGAVGCVAVRWRRRRAGSRAAGPLPAPASGGRGGRSGRR